MVLPKSGAMKKVAESFEAGFDICFKDFNSAGGKFVIDVNYQDDGYSVEKVQKVVKNLSNEKSILMGFVGTDALRSCLENKSLFLFPFEGVKSVDEKVYYYRASLESEISKLIEYALKNQLQNFAIFYENSIWGIEGKKIVEKLLDAQKIKPVASAYYPKGTVSIMVAVNEIYSKQPSTIICIAQPYPAFNFIEQIVNKGLTGSTFLGTNELFSIQNVVNRDRGKLILTSVVPNPLKSELEIVKKYRELMKKYKPLSDLSVSGLEGFIGAQIVLNSLLECDEKASVDELRKKIEGKLLKEKLFDPLNLSFDSKTRSLSNTVWLNENQDLDWAA